MVDAGTTSVHAEYDHAVEPDEAREIPADAPGYARYLLVVVAIVPFYISYPTTVT